MCERCDTENAEYAQKMLAECEDFIAALRKGELPEQFQSNGGTRQDVLSVIAARCAMIAANEAGDVPSMMMGMWAGTLMQAEMNVVGDMIAHAVEVQRTAPLN